MLHFYAPWKRDIGLKWDKLEAAKNSGAWSETSQISKMKFFAKIVDGYKLYFELLVEVY